MKIAIVGGGPAGLYFALLARMKLPGVDVVVYEQNPKGATYGFGIVLADRGLNRLKAADPESARLISEASFVSRHRVITHRGEKIFIEGGGYGVAIARLSDYELWIVVNHPLFTDKRCWRRARAVIDRELGDRCAVDLQIYAKSDIRIARAERDTFILDRIEAGITLYRASRDAPLYARERRGARP